ncbi:MAG TPA: outer membrane beta-barrel protein [Gammaproteobacteria bacterium]|nr:outer membrane beta-barrel protein [Gammaproteobacteria bacterium]
MLKKLLMVSTATLIATSNAQATNGIFIGLESGVSTFSNLPSAESVGANSLDTNLTPALRIGVGYNHDLTSYLGLGMNIAVGQYGEAVYHFDDGGSDTVKAQTVEFFAQITAHIKKFDVIAKVGGVRQKTEVTGTNAPSEDHYNNPAAGIELAYNFSPRFAITGTYQHVKGRNPESIQDIPDKSVPINEYLLGLRYTFASS